MAFDVKAEKDSLQRQAGTFFLIKLFQLERAPSSAGQGFLFGCIKESSPPNRSPENPSPTGATVCRVNKELHNSLRIFSLLTGFLIFDMV